MIVSTLSEVTRYSGSHPLFAQAFAFLSTINDQWEPGKYTISDTEAFVLVSDDLGRGKSDSPLEVHRRFIDIQLVLGGKEQVGWAPLETCRQLRSAYCEEKDIGFFSDHPQLWLTLPAGQLALFFPEDAHAPLAGSGPVRKAVAKIPVSR